MPDPRIIVALDFADGARAMALVDRLDPEMCALKIGKELFVSAGPDFVRSIVARGFKVFLDLKFHDIPNTVAQACAAATRLGVWMLNVHAAGGRAMLIAARESVIDAARALGRPAPRLVAVTVLTSLGQADLDEVGLSGGTEGAVLRLAKLANLCGLDGVVCSALEARTLRRVFGPAFILVTPGIRPAGSTSADQARIVTPEAAVAAGADFLVIGRPITEASDPVAALGRINAALGVPA
ncbi:MAG TPA: orotidine-5'-phosphate decarboxylase [Casimicrobiaceae bacterium]|nr:orotidine-5'-phosphate decarboxylase [Casimicrobiaceae bacterium]